PVDGIHRRMGRATNSFLLHQVPHPPSPVPSDPIDKRVRGRLGMSEFAEPRIRRLVADYLGVSADDLTPEVSLTDDLAADSLDLMELALVLEGELGLELPGRPS